MARREKKRKFYGEDYDIKEGYNRYKTILTSCQFLEILLITTYSIAEN